MAQSPGPSSLLQVGPARRRALLALFVVSTGVWLSLDQLGKGWAFASWRVPAGAVQIVPGFYAAPRLGITVGCTAWKGIALPSSKAFWPLPGLSS